MKNYSAFFLLIFLTTPVSASFTINDSNLVLSITNTNISFLPPATFTNISIGTDSIGLNNRTLQISPNNKATVIINTYDTINDSYNITISGSGTVDLQQEVGSNNQLYNFFSNLAYTFGVTSNNSGWIAKNSLVAGTYTWPNQYTIPQPASNNSQAGEATSGASQTNNLINLSNFTAPLQPYLNINSVAEDTTGMLIFQILFMLGFFMVAFFILKDNVQTSTLITGVILMGLSYYVIGDAVTTWISAI